MNQAPNPQRIVTRCDVCFFATDIGTFRRDGIVNVTGEGEEEDDDVDDLDEDAVCPSHGERCEFGGNEMG